MKSTNTFQRLLATFIILAAVCPSPSIKTLPNFVIPPQGDEIPVEPQNDDELYELRQA